MPVAAVSEYKFPMNDAVEKFHGNQLLFVGWDKHLMFYGTAAYPLPPAMKFSDLFAGPLAMSYSQHPDFEKIDWSKVTWLKGNQPWKPDYDKTLAEMAWFTKTVSVSKLLVWMVYSVSVSNLI